MTWTSDRGREVLHACRALGLLVPEQVAVMGGDEDSLLCETCNPPLSGVALTSERIGYEAAALFDRLLHGKRPPREPILIEPTRVVVRQSTDTLAINDPDLARAIAFIRVHAATAIRGQRRAPGRRCFAKLAGTPLPGGARPQSSGRDPRVRLDRTKQLLAETEMPVPQIAAASGFGSREYLAYAFKQATGLTPREFRHRVRGR